MGERNYRYHGEWEVRPDTRVSVNLRSWVNIDCRINDALFY